MVYEIEDIIGALCTNVVETDEDFQLFLEKDGKKYICRLWHDQDCCEVVWLDEITGNINDLIGTQILKACETIDSGIDYDGEHYTWTFYHFATIKGYVDLKWVGNSNGYYSECVDISIIELKDNE